MPLMINTNVQSLNAQRQLVKSGQEMSTAMERLSSGKRINRAADDAAGLAISNRMTSQVRGLDRAVANANDGVSLIQTAEGALDETTSILQRMRELSIQSANGIYSDADRGTLDAEVQQLKAEIDRISDTTTFNGQKLLDGSQGPVALQVGSQANETITVSIGAADTKTLGTGTGGDIVGSAMDFADFATLTAGSVYVNKQDIGSLTGQGITQVSTGGLQGVLDQLNDNVSNVEFDALLDYNASTAGTGIIRGDSQLNLTVDMMDGTTQTFEISDTGSMEELAAKINSQSGGVLQASVDDAGKLAITSTDVAQVTLAEAGTAGALAAAGGAAGDTNAKLTLTSKDGSDITISGGANNSAGIAAIADIDALGVNTRLEAGDVSSLSGGTIAAALGEGDLKINDVSIGTFSAATQAAAAVAINKLSAETGVIAEVNTTDSILKLNSVDGSEISIDFADTVTVGATTLAGIEETNNSTSAGKNIANVSVATAAGAQSAIEVIDGALEQINSNRADLGAVSNRLGNTVSNLMNVSENTSAARSRIMDADFAKETAMLSRAQVLQQASSAMLAQANSAPQQVLSLLR
ncbi:MAG: flagellar biosynthesis protein FliC [Cellvibrionaceae bacterium]